MIAFMIIGGVVNSRLKGRFKKYSQIPTVSGMSGKEIAEKMLTDNGILDVKVISVPGKLTDHYNPIDKTVNLSPDVYQGRHVSAAAVAAHECGHAVQHATAYQWLQMRSQMVPIVNISNKMMGTIFLLGIFGGSIIGMNWMVTLKLFIILQAIITLFSLITLPVEYDASNRALILPPLDYFLYAWKLRHSNKDIKLAELWTKVQEYIQKRQGKVYRKV